MSKVQNNAVVLPVFPVSEKFQPGKFPPIKLPPGKFPPGIFSLEFLIFFFFFFIIVTVIIDIT